MGLLTSVLQWLHVMGAAWLRYSRGLPQTMQCSALGVVIVWNFVVVCLSGLEKTTLLQL